MLLAIIICFSVMPLLAHVSVRTDGGLPQQTVARTVWLLSGTHSQRKTVKSVIKWSFILQPPKHTWACNFMPKTIPGSKISHLRKHNKSDLNILYLNTDVFKQTDSWNAWFCINKLNEIGVNICILMYLRPPLYSTFIHTWVVNEV